MSTANLFISSFYSAHSWGGCGGEPYAEKIIARHRLEEAAAKRKSAEIKQRYEAMRC